MHIWYILATGSDLFHRNGTGHLLIADFYSEFPITRNLRNISSRTITYHLKSIIDEQEIPEKLISDNGTQYNSAERWVFSVRYGFDHSTSSPFYPQSNGFIDQVNSPNSKNKGEGN